MLRNRKKEEVDLRNYYRVIQSFSLLIVLFLCIVISNLQISASTTDVWVLEEQELIEMEEIVVTKQIEIPPPPPRPPVPVEVPDDEIIEDIDIDIDSDLSLDGLLALPPPPEEPEEDFFVVVEKMPELIGGLAALQRNITYPEMARKAGIEGRVFVQFIVNEKGEVENPRVIRGIGGGCDEEALKAVSKAKFVPGFQRGRPVRVQYNLPIVFKLQN